jgi:hypothetical protein
VKRRYTLHGVAKISTGTRDGGRRVPYRGGIFFDTVPGWRADCPPLIREMVQYPLLLGPVLCALLRLFAHL